MSPWLQVALALGGLIVGVIGTLLFRRVSIKARTKEEVNDVVTGWIDTAEKNESLRTNDEAAAEFEKNFGVGRGAESVDGPSD